MSKTFTNGELSVLRKVMLGKRIVGTFYEEIAKGLCDRKYLVIYDDALGHYHCNQNFFSTNERALFDIRVEVVRRDLEINFKSR